MILVSLSEKLEIEKRISITPEIAKKYFDLGFEVKLKSNYGSHLGYTESDYIEVGVKFEDDELKLLKDANIIVQMGLLDDNKINNLKSGQIYIGVLNPYENQSKLTELVKKKNRSIFIRSITKNNKSTINGRSFITGEFSRL
mgnify:CR=1 FL=1|tara:strand:+ start:123 stop:548 length:426 start_codon:yes stop_codon:yes gene_type:complete